MVTEKESAADGKLGLEASGVEYHAKYSGTGATAAKLFVKGANATSYVFMVTEKESAADGKLGLEASGTAYIDLAGNAKTVTIGNAGDASYVFGADNDELLITDNTPSDFNLYTGSVDKKNLVSLPTVTGVDSTSSPARASPTARFQSKSATARPSLTTA